MRLSKLWSDIKLMLFFIWKGDKSIFILKIINIISLTVQTVIGALSMKWILDGIQTGTVKEAAYLILKIQLLQFLFYSIMTLVGRIIIPRTEYKLRNYLQNIFINKSLLHDLECYEDFEFYDNYTKAARVADKKAMDFLNMMSDLVRQIITLISLIGIISSMDPILLLFTLIIILVTIFDTNRSNYWSHEEYEAEQSIERRANYIKKIAHQRQFAKDVRIYNWGSFLIKKLNETFKEKYQIFKKYNDKYWRIKYIVNLTNTLIISPAIMIYLVYCLFTGSITIGSFTVLLGICYSVSGQVSAIFNDISNLNFESQYYVSHLRGILEYNSTIEAASSSNYRNITAIETIEFKNVSFSYPHHEVQVLKNISFKIEKKQKVAIVGKNGVGKSTLVKLLLRLYDVTEGEILINGISIKEYNIKDLRKCFSCTLQDYNIYAFTVAENVSMQNLQDEDKIMESLSFTNMDGRIGSLKNTYRSYISREFDEHGVEFSGGERQKLAISRAYYNKSSVFIMDEANSALDPLAEYDLNSKIISNLEDQTVIFVTHRLSTTTHADTILVLDQGKLIDKGNHLELMERNTLYNSMFSCQAKAYLSRKELQKYE